MVTQSMDTPHASLGQTQVLFFNGDNVRLGGQIDYPNSVMPEGGYPLLFIIQHATCHTRSGYAHFTRLGNEQGAAVFLWDKRGTGDSGAGVGSTLVDVVNAYKTALTQPNINPQRVVIIAQNEGSLILREAWSQFVALQRPCGVVLVGNMLDEKQILTLNVPLHIAISKNDWNAWQIYADAASKAHQQKYGHSQSFYVAPVTNRLLMYENGGAFHRGANESIKEWLSTRCQILALT